MECDLIPHACRQARARMGSRVFSDLGNEVRGMPGSTATHPPPCHIGLAALGPRPPHRDLARRGTWLRGAPRGERTVCVVESLLDRQRHLPLLQRVRVLRPRRPGAEQKRGEHGGEQAGRRGATRARGGRQMRRRTVPQRAAKRAAARARRPTTPETGEGNAGAAGPAPVSTRERRSRGRPGASPEPVGRARPMASAARCTRRPRKPPRRAEIIVARLGSARLGSARLGSARLGSARLGSARLGSARLGSARLGSARLGSARLGSARLGSARLGSARLGSARLGSARPRKATYSARPFRGRCDIHHHDDHLDDLPARQRGESTHTAPPVGLGLELYPQEKPMEIGPHMGYGTGGRPASASPRRARLACAPNASLGLAIVLGEAVDTARALTAARYGIRHHRRRGGRGARVRLLGLHRGRAPPVHRVAGRTEAVPASSRRTGPGAPHRPSRAGPLAWLLPGPGALEDLPGHPDAPQRRDRSARFLPRRSARGWWRRTNRARIRGRQAAADCVVKPFPATELTARIGAALRARAGAAPVRARRARHRLRAAPGEGGRTRGGADGHRVRDPADPLRSMPDGW